MMMLGEIFGLVLREVGLFCKQNRFLVVFGGGSVAHCYNDVTLLDTKTNEWSCPQTSGTAPTPRAGALLPQLNSPFLAWLLLYLISCWGCSRATPCTFAVLHSFFHSPHLCQCKHCLR